MVESAECVAVDARKFVDANGADKLSSIDGAVFGGLHHDELATLRSSVAGHWCCAEMETATPRLCFVFLRQHRPPSLVCPGAGRSLRGRHSGPFHAISTVHRPRRLTFQETVPQAPGDGPSPLRLRTLHPTYQTRLVIVPTLSWTTLGWTDLRRVADCSATCPKDRAEAKATDPTTTTFAVDRATPWISDEATTRISAAATTNLGGVKARLAAD